MYYLIAIALALLLVWVVVNLVLGVIGIVAYVVTRPFIPPMRLIQSVGLTDSGWYIVLHAVMGAGVAMWVHLSRWPWTINVIVIGVFVVVMSALSC